jgi:hypothetical protein
MRKFFWVILLNICAVCISSAQIKDLSALSSGDMKLFYALYDTKGKIYGYYLMYDKGKISKDTKEFEFVVLDKNLIQLLTNTLTGPEYVVCYYGSLNDNNELLLYPYVTSEDKVKYRNKAVPDMHKVNLTTNAITVWRGYCFENNQIVECKEEGTFKEQEDKAKMEKKENGYVHISRVYRGDFGGYLVIESDDYGKFDKDFTIRRFDDHKKESWKYTIEDEANKKKFYFTRILHIDSTTLYGFKIFTNKDEYERCYFMVWDMKTGQVIKNKLVTEVPAESMVSMLYLMAEGLGSKLDSYKSFDDKIVLTGNTYKKRGLFKAPNGYFRCVIDKSNHELAFDMLEFTPDFKEHLPNISTYGELEKGYSLSIRDVFFLSDRSIIYIFEKYKFSADFFTGYSAKNDDLIFVIADSNFQIKNVKVMDKEKSKHSASDYLFGQYLNDGKDFAFFYQDFKKEKDDKDESWLLYINTWINGQLNEEQFPIASKQNVIYPYVAKEGYILLREYNDKAKYNQARLEKLNF